MRLLYLVRHASPRIQPNAPARDWPLSDRGIEEARALAAVAGGWGLRAVYASPEEKARTTALLLAEPAGLPVAVVPGFEELRVDDWIGNADEFSDLVRRVLEDPDVSARGAERAAAAAARFEAALRVVEQGPFPAAVVSHGRVLAAYLTELLWLDDPFAFWRAIPMPAWASLDLDASPPTLASPFTSVPL